MVAVVGLSLLACCSLLPSPLSPSAQSHIASFGSQRAPAFHMRVQKEAPAVAPEFSLPLLLQPEPAIAGGLALLTLLVGNRLFTEDLLNSQSRADLIAAIAPVLIILKALGDLDITPREADPVAPLGEATAWVEPSLADVVKDELEWAADSLLVAPCTAMALWRDGRTLMLRGTVPSAAAATPANAVIPGPLLTKAVARRSGAPDYLPALQLLPGRVEFSYMPENSQGILMLPLSGDAAGGALVLAADRQRGFGEEDISWARAVASRISESLTA